MGLAVFLMDWFKKYTGWNIPLMMSAFYLFVVCSAIMVAVLLARPHEHTALSERLVWKSPLEAVRRQGWKGIGSYKFLAILSFVTMVIFYTIFATVSSKQFFGLII
jgi:SSS family solute:Na+ symporter